MEGAVGKLLQVLSSSFSFLLAESLMRYTTVSFLLFSRAILLPRSREMLMRCSFVLACLSQKVCLVVVG